MPGCNSELRRNGHPKTCILIKHFYLTSIGRFIFCRNYPCINEAWCDGRLNHGNTVPRTPYGHYADRVANDKKSHVNRRVLRVVQLENDAEQAQGVILPSCHVVCAQRDA